MSTYVISDIHGCYDKLMDMLNKIGFSTKDKLIIHVKNMVTEDAFCYNYKKCFWVEE